MTDGGTDVVDGLSRNEKIEQINRSLGRLADVELNELQAFILNEFGIYNGLTTDEISKVRK